MARDFDSEIVQHFTKDICLKLSGAARVAQAARLQGEQGQSECAILSLQDLETLVFETGVLVNAALIIGRRKSENRSGAS